MSETDHFVVDGIMRFTPSEPNLSFMGSNAQVLFTIKGDGTIERGPAFTTTDAMSLEFWRMIEQVRPKPTA